ncbi:MAG: hypothetical protein U1C33_07630 [Candidatus Cloacimonadaceae bacterium]|nr:hypothetical protein [Candidatus Cloacimonadaceae bacterium]
MIRDLLNSFVGRMQREFPHVKFRFEYNKTEESYRIWHTSYKPNEEVDFLTFMGGLIKNLFIPNNFFNFYLDFNAEYDDKINNASQWFNTDNHCKELKVTWTPIRMDTPTRQEPYSYGQVKELCNMDKSYTVKNQTRETQCNDAKIKEAA